MARALMMAEAGRAGPAREALLLGQRFLRAARDFAGLLPEPPPTPEEEAASAAYYEDLRTQLEQRLDKLLAIEMARPEAEDGAP